MSSSSTQECRSWDSSLDGMKIEVILTESEIAQELADAMEARDLPEKFFYWLPGSVHAWLALSRTAVYDGLREGWQLLSGRLADALSHFDDSIPVISFGAGDGSRDLSLIQALRQSSKAQYFPVDASQPLLELACAAAEDADIETAGIKADISSPVHLVFASDAAESPKLFLMSGNTLGAFDPLDEIRHVADCLRPEDRLIVDGELWREDTLTRRQAKPVGTFLFAPLLAMGIASEDGNVRFNHKRDERHAGLNQIRRFFHAERDLRATLPGREFLFARGERIGMNFAYAYTPEAFRWLLTEHAGLTILEEVTTGDERFLIALCARPK